MFKYSVIFVFAVMLLACTQKIYKKAPSACTSPWYSIVAVSETDSVLHNKAMDAADDPAIWYNSDAPEASLLLGTDKKGGLMVFALSGNLIKYHSVGNMNNVDIRYGLITESDTVDILAASNRSRNTIDVFSIAPDGGITSLTNKGISPKSSAEVYGICLYRNRQSGEHFVFVNNKSGEVEQWQLIPSGDSVTGIYNRTLKLPSQVEGMVADDELDILYVAEEDSGIWRFDARPQGALQGTKLAMGDVSQNKCLKADMEGLALSYSRQGGYLIASSQGNNSFAVFSRMGNNTYLGSFVVANGVIDGVAETDGIEVLNLPLGNRFPNGLFIAQDGFNRDAKGKKQPQNFKLVDWGELEKVFRSGMQADSAYSPMFGN